eukprot:TRINITY_DN12397_c3_g2_i1.p1 TRINITY_DN12397_c3_g2~~TRINITY_DN12397_c3_g2_i1.p1  ORF type:complete len:927 (+),score=270.91 TRINITY_DN12397_c3_g2_i1:144-2783(+)
MDPRYCCDYQELKVQQRMSTLAFGTIPKAVHVILTHELVDSCKAGDDVVVSAVVKQRWQPARMDDRCQLEVVLDANHIDITNDKIAAINITDELREAFEAHWRQHFQRPMTARNQIVSSFCPQVFGMYVVKLAVIMVVTGGVARTDPSGTRTRGESHMLLVGDPGTGKSQFLKYACELVPRSVITTGIGSSSAGLTVTAVKDEGEWCLEAGALVLADGGLCCIDEFSGIREHDRGSIHEAMEQQTLSVAKAGLVCKLNTRTTILAATNPKGSYDPEESLSVNVAVASPLLSRFDVIMVLLDTKSADWDTHVSDFILQQRTVSAAQAQQDKDLWTMNKLKAYLAYIKSFAPKVSSAAQQVLSKYYQLQRLADNGQQARTTIRMLESLIRIAQAHARLMCHGEVSLVDAVVAVTVMESSMQGAALLGASSPLHSAFPSDPEAEYLRQEQLILTCLQLENLKGQTIMMTDTGPANCNGPINTNSTPSGGDAGHADNSTGANELATSGGDKGPTMEDPTQGGYMFLSQAVAVNAVRRKRLEKERQQQLLQQQQQREGDDGSQALFSSYFHESGTASGEQQKAKKSKRGGRAKGKGVRQGSNKKRQQEDAQLLSDDSEDDNNDDVHLAAAAADHDHAQDESKPATSSSGVDLDAYAYQGSDKAVAHADSNDEDDSDADNSLSQHSLYSQMQRKADEQDGKADQRRSMSRTTPSRQPTKHTRTAVHNNSSGNNRLNVMALSSSSGGQHLPNTNPALPSLGSQTQSQIKARREPKDDHVSHADNTGLGALAAFNFQQPRRRKGKRNEHGELIEDAPVSETKSKTAKRTDESEERTGNGSQAAATPSGVALRNHNVRSDVDVLAELGMTAQQAAAAGPTRKKKGFAK